MVSIIYARLIIAIIWAMFRSGVPSAISVARFASVWYLPELMQADYRSTFLIVAICAALSDWLDGELARKWDCATKLGGALDLLGDKGLCIILMYLGTYVWDSVWWYIGPCIVLVIYHTTVMSLRLIGVVRYQSSRVAKIKMFVEVTGLVMCFSSFGLGPLFGWADWLGLALVWGAAMLAFWSMLEYLGYMPDWPTWLYPRRMD
ncbi:hypothetical protein A3A39_00055 [Candidatus Kaiserbacteria bacterium RIFCSPLOWO2_01_FULL_54_13]|uniref:CDP-diacylglycerol--glycerol-3-phosphate 3-phosphatidyltransferase n=1 Tax=Candidatus Kaiserbacteria bacterium RIFCSPLOWO2_01_FULL_54_13 TaxID=1798512 RepID=A0A1F6F4G4_9BACT|nr:MAG: hypothetical protein A3A39_00055 [Candidatus Kaiserbacteria bacterium RIFCSPLOWO2_01_FULL_54_13]